MLAHQSSDCLSLQITTLEKHFNFSSSVSGFLMSCNDIGYLATTLFMSYYTRRIHIPRAMAVSSIVYGVAGVLCAMAFFGTIDHMTSPQKETGNSEYFYHLYIFFFSSLRFIHKIRHSGCRTVKAQKRTPHIMKPLKEDTFIL